MSTDTIDALSVITVDYRKSLQEMIAAGRYDWTNGDITPTRFPIAGTGEIKLEAKLFHFDRYMLSNAAAAAIKADDPQHPWEPAKIEALLAYGAQNPDEQFKYPITALGSVAGVVGTSRVPCLDRCGYERCLYLRWWGGVWSGACRFLGVRKLASLGLDYGLAPIDFFNPN